MNKEDQNVSREIIPVTDANDDSKDVIRPFVLM